MYTSLKRSFLGGTSEGDSINRLIRNESASIVCWICRVGVSFLGVCVMRFEQWENDMHHDGERCSSGIAIEHSGRLHTSEVGLQAKKRSLSVSSATNHACAMSSQSITDQNPSAKTRRSVFRQQLWSVHLWKWQLLIFIGVLVQVFKWYLQFLPHR